MTNLWILTEERPKNSVVLTILQEYCKIKNEQIECDEIIISPLNMRFKEFLLVTSPESTSK